MCLKGISLWQIAGNYTKRTLHNVAVSKATGLFEWNVLRGKGNVILSSKSSDHFAARQRPSPGCNWGTVKDHVAETGSCRIDAFYRYIMFKFSFPLSHETLLVWSKVSVSSRYRIISQTFIEWEPELFSWENKS